MVYSGFQQEVYENKLRRGFNVTDLGKELNLMTEELGELSDACISNSHDDIVDAVGDLMVYCLGLSAMFKWDADDIILSDVQHPVRRENIINYVPYVARELGFIAKAYKKSNKLAVDSLDNRDLFMEHIGKLMGYCDAMFEVVQASGVSVLESIIHNNRTRTHQGKM